MEKQQALNAVFATTCAAVLLAVVAVSLYFGGYEQRVAWNGALVETTCANVRHEVTERTCTYSCNCHRVCDYVVRERADGTPYTVETCGPVCSQCTRACYDAQCIYAYEVHATETRVEKQSTVSTRKDTHDEALAALRDDCAINATWTCYYDVNDTQHLVTDYYNADGFYTAAMVFVALASAAGGLALSFAGMYAARVVQERMKPPPVAAAATTTTPISAPLPVPTNTAPDAHVRMTIGEAHNVPTTYRARIASFRVLDSSSSSSDSESPPPPPPPRSRRTSSRAVAARASPTDRVLSVTRTIDGVPAPVFGTPMRSRSHYYGFTQTRIIEGAHPYGL